jgi:hypothetical protein
MKEPNLHHTRLSIPLKNRMRHLVRELADKYELDDRAVNRVLAASLGVDVVRRQFDMFLQGWLQMGPEYVSLLKGDDETEGESGAQS